MHILEPVRSNCLLVLYSRHSSHYDKFFAQQDYCSHPHLYEGILGSFPLQHSIIFSPGSLKVYLPMPFFQQAKTIHVERSSMTDVRGNYAHHDHSTHTTNKNSFNTDTYSVADSFNDSSRQYIGNNRYGKSRPDPSARYSPRTRTTRRGTPDQSSFHHIYSPQRSRHASPAPMQGERDPNQTAQSHHLFVPQHDLGPVVGSEGILGDEGMRHRGAFQSPLGSLRGFPNLTSPVLSALTHTTSLPNPDSAYAVLDPVTLTPFLTVHPPPNQEMVNGSENSKNDGQVV